MYNVLDTVELKSSMNIFEQNSLFVIFFFWPLGQFVDLLLLIAPWVSLGFSLRHL
jgi:hypothetical protein